MSFLAPASPIFSPILLGSGPCRWVSSYMGTWLLAGANPSLYQIFLSCDNYICYVTKLPVMWLDIAYHKRTHGGNHWATSRIQQRTGRSTFSSRGRAADPEERDTEGILLHQSSGSQFISHHHMKKDQATGWLDKLILQTVVPQQLHWTWPSGHTGSQQYIISATASTTWCCRTVQFLLQASTNSLN